jgi:magnesium-transporting ATPase (P-type)
MVSTSSQLGLDNAESLMISSINYALKEIPKQTAEILWSVLLSLLKQYWLFFMIILFIVLVIATVKAMFGRWGTFGSVLYHVLYFGTLLMVGLIWGPDVFVSDFFHAACTLVLYPICYYIVGLILDRTGFHRF